MLVSVFTPTHNPQWLEEIWKYLKNEPFYEWVIVPNGRIIKEAIPPAIRNDKRVKIHRYSGNTKIGSIKNFACSQCTGDVMLELDHDDILLPGAVDAVMDIFTDENVVFAYSDSANFNDDGSPVTDYRADYGWTYRDFTFEGKTYRVPYRPDHTAYHVSLIWFAPNHLRAWRTSTYNRIGGHNVNLSVCDDQDLMCRLFLEGEFAYIPECYYLYRIYGGNSWLKRNEDIQNKTRELHKRYIRQLIDAECKNQIKIDICGGVDSPPNYISVDLIGADITSDLNKRWPFDDSSVSVVRASDGLEHLVDQRFTMSEIFRVLRPGGYLVSDTPSTTGPKGESGMGAWQDPTHKTFWNRNTFWYWTRQLQAQYIENTTIRFFPMILENYFPSPWHAENFVPYVRADLISLKDNYRPHGLLTI